MEKQIALELKHISKYFGKVAANKDVNLCLAKFSPFSEKTEAVKPPL